MDKIMDYLNTEDLSQIENISKFLKVIADPNRLKILTLLSHDCKCVCDISEALNLPQNLVSHHLGKLKEAGVLSEHKRGYFSVHHLNRGVLKENEAKLNKLLKRKPKTKIDKAVQHNCLEK
ncbi:MAG: metalloregulator ArsR/SmtB family transcription factor [Patescibacteria group bacterium]|jgi:ArsR family transcriptional regulator